MRLRYVSTVGRPRWSRSAISLVGAPEPMSLKISSSRSVKLRREITQGAAPAPCTLSLGHQAFSQRAGSIRAKISG